MKTKSLLFFIFMSLCIPNLFADDHNDINDKLNEITKKIEKIEDELILIEDGVSIFDLTGQTSIDKINTNAGPLYLKITDVSSADDGYKVEVQIGNPLLATFGEVTLQLAWYSKDGWKRKDFSVDGQLQPASWTPEVIHLTPVESKEFLKAVLMSIKIGKMDFVGK